MARAGGGAGGLALLILVLFFLPMGLGGKGRIHEQLENLLHVPAFFAWTLCFFALMSLRLRMPLRVYVAVAAAWLCALGVEWLQPWVGRTAEPVDVGMGMIGSLLGGVWLWGRKAPGARRLAWGLGGGLIALAILPLMWVLTDQYRAKQLFPLLASFESAAELGRWNFHGIKAKRWVEHAQTGRFSLRVEIAEPGSYPGLFMAEGPKDWSSLRQICFEVVGLEGCRLWVRLDDLPDNPPYGERFQALYVLTNGVQTICVDSAACCTEQGRRLDLSHVYAFGLFFDGVRQGDVMYFDDIRGVR